ncbi:hypothetical protein [Thermogemmatispora sp.]|uniref:hypothetical protein n=1 Tax=Thermogemmatispora sp. TaxID=1968838 RepID=UPI0035E42B57
MATVPGSMLPQSGIATSREDHIAALRAELGPSERTEHLIDWLLDMWETIDLLTARFGVARAWRIIAAPTSPSPSQGGSTTNHLRGEASALADLPSDS